MARTRGSSVRSLARLVGWAGSFVLLALAGWMYLRVQDAGSSIPEAGARVEPSAVELPSPESRPAGDLVLHRLPLGLGQAEIYDIEPAPSGLWLGTGKGLVHRDPEGRWFLYRRFSAAPAEWVQAVAMTDRGIAASVWVAPGSTSGTPMGTFLFRPRDRVWISGGETSFISLDWDGTRLWGLIGSRLHRTSMDAGTFVWEEVDPGVRICTEGRLVVAAGRVWVAQQGVVRIGRLSSRPVPCGVVELSPGTGEARAWNEADGLASGFGRSVAGDAREVWAAHGVQGEGLSRYDVVSGRWSAMRSSRNGVYLGANTIGLTPNAVWLGTPDGRRPLKRLDRMTGEARVIQGVPEEFYVTAVDGDEEGAWVGLSRKHWEGDTYRVESLLGWVPDRAGPEGSLRPRTDPR